MSKTKDTNVMDGGSKDREGVPLPRAKMDLRQGKIQGSQRGRRALGKGDGETSP